MYIEKAQLREGFSYGKVETDFLYSALDQYPVKQQNGIVLGTETPWVEGILLASGKAKGAEQFIAIPCCIAELLALLA